MEIMQLMYSVIDSLKRGNFFLALLIVVFIVLIRLNKILNFYNDLKHYKIKTFKNLYDDVENMDQCLQKLAQECINNEIFYQLTGINAEKFKREKICEIYEKAQGSINYKDLKTAQRFLAIENGELIIKIRFIDKVDKWFNFFLSLLLIIVASYMVSISFFINKPTLTQILISYAFGIATYLFAGFLIAQTFPIRKAEKIEKIILGLREKKSS